MARGRRPRPKNRSRATTWVAPADQGSVSVASNTSVIISSFDPFAALLDASVTIVRSRGLLRVQPQTLTAGIEVNGAVGACVVTDQAFAAGAASIPGPWTNADWDGWFIWQEYSMRWDQATDVGRQIASIQYEIDSKAMRKVQANETVVLMAESQVGLIEAFFAPRMLFKLS